MGRFGLERIRKRSRLRIGDGVYVIQLDRAIDPVAEPLSGP